MPNAHPSLWLARRYAVPSEYRTDLFLDGLNWPERDIPRTNRRLFLPRGASAPAVTPNPLHARGR